jgi:hypothetical protein
MCIAIDIPPVGMYLPSVERKRKLPTGIHTCSNVGFRRGRRPSVSLSRYRISLLIILIISAVLLFGCQQHNPLEEQKTRTLTPDERYLIELYMKITEFEENLQDNPEGSEEKREELRDEIDIERLRRILDELEQNPERWLAIYNRIHELESRRRPDPSN